MPGNRREAQGAPASIIPEVAIVPVVFFAQGEGQPSQVNDPMKWILIWIGVFTSAATVFVVIPQPTLLSLANPIDALGPALQRIMQGLAPASEPVTEPARPAQIKRESPSARKTYEEKPDAHGRASQRGRTLCKAAAIELTGPWEPAAKPNYVTNFTSFTPDFDSEPHEQWETLGLHETSEFLEWSMQYQNQCGTNTCRACVVAITATIGYTPSVITLHEDLRRNHCARTLVMRHEQEHAAITGTAQGMVLKKARQNLRWASRAHPGRVVQPNTEEREIDKVMAKISEDLTRAFDQARAYSTKANDQLDQPKRYLRESQERWRRCRRR